MNASTAPGVAVEFDRIVKAFGPVHVLHGVSFGLDAGRVYGLLGESGGRQVDAGEDPVRLRATHGRRAAHPRQAAMHAC